MFCSVWKHGLCTVCLKEKNRSVSEVHTNVWVYTPLLPYPITFYTKSTVTQLHSQTLAVFTANQKITVQKLMLAHPINHFVKNVDHKLPWDFTVTWRSVNRRCFRLKEKDKKINSWAQDFYLRYFSWASIFYTKDNVGWFHLQPKGKNRARFLLESRFLLWSGSQHTLGAVVQSVSSRM